jgi:hypothetical protein
VADHSVIPPAIPSVIAPPVIPLSGLVPVRDRVVPVEPALTSLFPDAGLRRGHVVSCGGVAAWSLACAVAARAVAAGSWLAVVGVDGFGVEAALEHGVAPERVVAVAAPDVGAWADRLAAAADGFELLLTAPPRGAERSMRQLRQRLQARGSILLTVPPPSRAGHDARRDAGRAAPFPADVELTTTDAAWLGIEVGHGRLLARRVTIRAGGRRVPRPITLDCWLPGPDGCVDVVQRGVQCGVQCGVVPDELVEIRAS